MTDGASPGVHRIIQLLTRTENDAFLTPVPQYPLYSASLALYGTTLTPYYLDESINWGLNLEHLQDQYDKVKSVYTKTRNRRFAFRVHPFSACSVHSRWCLLVGQLSVFAL